MKKKSRLSKKKLKGAILEIIRQSPGKKFNYKQLSKALRIKKIGEKLLVTEALYDLRDEGLVNEISRGSYVLVNKNKPTTGIVISSNRGGVVVKTVCGLEIDIDKKDSLFCLKGDEVEIISFSGRKKTKGFISNVLSRKKISFVGKVQLNNSVCFFIADDYRVYFDVFIRNTKLKSTIKNKQVHVRVTNWNCNNKNPEGEIIEVLGDINNLDVAINSILIDGGFANKFNSNVEKAARGISKNISSSEIKSRLDLRNTPTFTIDPNDAKDFDDAISVLKLPNNNLEIGVHIADVAHYIKKDDIIDKEALKRGTSVYLVDRVIPMLPEVLSNDLCSLKPKIDRLCFSVIFEINSKAEILNYKISKSIIHSNKRLTYKEAQDNIDNASGDYHKELISINNLAKILRNKRKEEGSINFEREETKFLLDKDNNPIDVYTKESLETNKLIEEYMLLANKAVAKHINEKMNNYSFIYRVHDIPDKEKFLI
jgi:ribonuclease R